MMLKIAIFSVLIVSLIACNKFPLTNKPTNGNTIIIDSKLYENAPSDDFIIGDIVIIKDSIYITVSYGGGCGDVDFKLIDQGVIMESYPIQRNIRLSFKDDDLCKALIGRTLSFSLLPIKDSSYDKVNFNLEGYSDQILYQY